MTSIKRLNNQNTFITTAIIFLVILFIALLLLLIAVLRQPSQAQARPNRVQSGFAQGQIGSEQAAALSNQVEAGGDPLAYLPMITGDGPNGGDDEPIPFGQVYNGEGTYYFGDGSGACLFPPIPGNPMYAAMNYPQFGNSDFCGAYVNITGPQGSVIVRITDMCPGCQYGDIDMSPEAFEQIAEIQQGRVPISWQLVSYPLDGPIVYHFKDGSNQWWTAVQIRNHRNPIAKFEYRASGGNWVEVSRTTYNYFVEASGMGPGPYTFRVTDVFGNTIVDSGIPHVENGDVSGGDQFPPPP